MVDDTVNVDAVNNKVTQLDQMLGAHRRTLASLLLLSIWCGLCAGLLEVATIVFRKHTFDSNQFYGMSRQFVWLIPATNLGVFLAVGLIGGILSLAWPRSGRRVVARVL
jgi:hypothetical protein